MKKMCILFSTLLLLSGMGCSYVMDSVEGAITKRSSFSVDVSKNGSSFTLDWSKDAPSIDTEAFAGYEIYITNSANNEFAGYDILLSGNAGNPGLAGSNTLLTSANTTSVTFTYNPSVIAGDTYFFRVGVVYWDEEKGSDRVSKWTIANGYSYNWNAGSPTVVNYYYPLKTKLEKTSGGTMVTF